MPFPAELVAHRGQKLEIATKEQADAALAGVEGAAFRIASIKKREVKRNAPAPFTTSTLQQEASRKLKMRVRRTMQVAQALYEGVDFGGSEGTVGLITYMRTDSTRLSDQARDAAREFIVETYGEPFHGGRVHKVREGAQDAHEAIRPTSAFHTPQTVAGALKRDELRLYTMIWERFVASQMSAAILDQTTVDVEANEYTFRATGTVTRFAGFTRVYEEGKDEDAGAAGDPSLNGSTPAAAIKPKGRVPLPELSQDESLDCRRLEPKQHFTEPPPRFTEASLVKALEDNGVGRPSTYSTIVDTIQARGYVTQQERRFVPTEIGMAVNDLLGRTFSEDRQPRLHRDDGRRSRQSGGRQRGLGRVAARLLRAVRGRARGRREETSAHRTARRTDRRDLPQLRAADGDQDRALRPVHFVHGISRVQDHANRSSKTPARSVPRTAATIVERRSRKGRTFYGCANYPNCDFVSWDRVVAEPCPVCGSYVIAKTRRGGNVRFECAAHPEHDVSAIAKAEGDDGSAELEPAR